MAAEDDMAYNKFIGGALTALVVLSVSSSLALACAGGFMQAFLFQQYPEAKATNMAISKARMRGTLKGEEWARTSGKSLHAWRAARTMLTIKTLQKRFSSAMSPSVAMVDTNVFLLNEFTWLGITTDGKRITVARRPFGSRMKGTRIFTSRRVLDNVLSGAIAWQEAVDQGLIVSSCKDDCAGNPYGNLGLAMTTPQPSARANVQ